MKLLHHRGAERVFASAAAPPTPQRHFVLQYKYGACYPRRLYPPPPAAAAATAAAAARAVALADAAVPVRAAAVPNILEARGPYRAEHIAAAQRQVDAGHMLLAGAFSEAAKDGRARARAANTAAAPYTALHA